MENELTAGEYQANNADTLVSELFSGGLTVAESIERLRTRLLDLSARNRLLNYRHPKGRCIQIADDPGINLVFERLYVDGKGVPFKYVPEPPLDSYEGKRPEARLQAPRVGISTSVEFEPDRTGSNGRRLHGVQTLLYPAELERQLRKIAGEGKTAIEETGSNMLFLIFGFLEFYDSEDSERPMLAPLLSLPVALTRGDIDRVTRTYQYTVQHNGEDLAENHTLREKLRRDFMLSLPEFGEDDEPETYLSGIEQAVQNKRNWKVRRQITLGMLSFGKLAIWADLDSKKNPGLTEKELIKLVFSGSTGGGDGGLYAEDYRIDELPEASQPLIYDADSSQHSAIIDVLSGKNLVINGPPGTGKSQTITNVIAAALAKGKKVLFVSEKLAALEVVRHRLNHAGLGHFCLELHSHKTQKKKFLEDIKARIEERFPPSSQFQAKLATLNRQKVELARYAELMGSRVENALDLTVNEIFWAAERRRQELGELSAAVNAIGFPDASAWTYDDIESRKSRLAGFTELYEAIDRYDTEHPWWGFFPDPLAPSDDDAIERIVAEALVHARRADGAAAETVEFFALAEQPDADSATRICDVLKSVPEVPPGANPLLLSRMFDFESDPDGLRSSQLLFDVVNGVTRARQHFESAARVLIDGTRLPEQECDELRTLAEHRKLVSTLIESEIEMALGMVASLEKALGVFVAVARTAHAPYSLAGKVEIDSFLATTRKISATGLESCKISTIISKAEAVLDIAKSLTEAVSRINAIANRGGLQFDSSPNSVALLAAPDGLPGLLASTSVDEALLSEAKRLATFPLSDKSLEVLWEIRSRLELEATACSEALERCQKASERIGLGLDSTERAVMEILSLAKVAAAAPIDLLEYRKQTFGHAKSAELIEVIRAALAAEIENKTNFDPLFYLDTLPDPAAIKLAVAALRQKQGFWAFLDEDWRKARKLHQGLCKGKRKLSGIQRAEELAKLASWIEARVSFVADPDIKECFGGLFRGLDTDLDRISRLNDWYLTAKSIMIDCSGLVDKVNLTDLAADRIAELASKAALISSDAGKLSGAEVAVREILGADVAGFRQAKARSWNAGLETLSKAVESIGLVAKFFEGWADVKLSPRDALRLMEARAELDGASNEINSLLNGEKALREAGSEDLGCPGITPDVRWSEVLSIISEQATNVLETANQALAFTTKDSPLSTAYTFANAKLDLDEAWSNVALLPEWDRFEAWDALAEFADEDATAARRLLERLASIARENATARDVFRAIEELKKGETTLDNLSASEDVHRILGNAFTGMDTNLDQLQLTHNWGVTVSSLNLPQPLKQHLLNSKAAESLLAARRFYGEIADGCAKARQVIEGLASFGTFSWDEWRRQERRNIDRDLPMEIKGRLETAAIKPGSVLPWSKYLSIRQQTRLEGMTDFVTALESGRIPSSKLASAFELAVYQSIGRTIYQSFPELSRFNGAAHEKTRSDYRALDSEIVSLTGKDFASQIERRTQVPEGQRGTTVGDYTELHLLRREINKQRRHIPIRQLIKRAGRALQELKPCFMMGPLSVAQYLEQGSLKFDLVVMDEASQLRPEEALGAIARGSQLVVVGDPKQLPPTSFFDRLADAGDDDDEDEAPAAISGMESILDICQQLFTPVRSLRWHYRSHHESLIAFSNHHFYKNLIVFPSPYAKSPGLGVKYRFVNSGLYRDRQNLPEAQRVVDAVLEHMIKRSDESLGVVTLNQTQRDLIEELLDKKLKTFDEGADFLGHWEVEGWPFFIKNLENVQGDERDVIFISTTFGKAPGMDKPRQNFGPISRPDGWRRLNVLFTRSKRRIELFTSLSPDDIVIDEKTPRGTKALRDYLDFAKRGVLVTTDESERDPDSDFEIAVANVITNMGYEVKPQLGVAGFFIDMAVRNPDRPGEFIAGIECDGATYHSGFSVRDRDRIRQDILETLGWRNRIYRIWSTDWFYNPRREIDRLRSFLEERRRLSLLDETFEQDIEIEEESQDAMETPESEALAEAVAAVANDTEDMFVEVGDRVTYCPTDKPDERHSIMIVDSESNVKMGIVNEETPLAQALLGLSPGDVGVLEVAGQRDRQLRVLKVQRQEDLINN